VHRRPARSFHRSSIPVSWVGRNNPAHSSSLLPSQDCAWAHVAPLPPVVTGALLCRETEKDGPSSSVRLARFDCVQSASRLVIRSEDWLVEHTRRSGRVSFPVSPSPAIMASASLVPAPRVQSPLPAAFDRLWISPLPRRRPSQPLATPEALPYRATRMCILTRD